MHALSRRNLLTSSAALLAGRSTVAQTRGAARPLVVVQLVDTSDAQQDIARDVLVGARTCWQALNQRGGVRGRPVQHLVLETDGSLASVRAGLQRASADPACVALVGTAGDRTAVTSVAALHEIDAGLPHVAPWLQDGTVEVDAQTFPIFAGRQEQIAHALRSLAGVGITEAGAVYATEQDWQLHRADVERAAAGLNLRLSSWRAGGDPARVASRLTPGTPAVLLFVGGTPELVAFSQGLERQQRQRWVIALADVNLQTVAQLGGSRSSSVIAAQPVPALSSALPVVRAWRDAQARLFDETPTPHALAGYISASYLAQVLGELEQPGRQSLLAALQRRQPRDVGGFRVDFDARRRSAGFVTQTLLTPDGRLVG